MVFALLHENETSAGALRQELCGQALRTVRQRKTRGESGSVLLCGFAPVLAEIRLPHAVSGADDAVGKFAVVRQKQKSLGLLVEPSHRRDAEGTHVRGNELHDGF